MVYFVFRGLERTESLSVDYVTGSAGTGQLQVRYPQINFKPVNFFALGSPIAMFMTTRGIDAIGEDYSLPTCDGFFNIFHPVSKHRRDRYRYSIWYQILGLNEKIIVSKKIEILYFNI